MLLSKRGKTSRASAPANSRPVNKQFRNNIISDGVDQAQSTHPGSIKSNEITATNIETIPQSVNAEAARIKVEDLLIKGQNYFRTGQYDKAVMQFSQAIKSGGNRKMALYNRGVALFKLNKKDAALKDFKFAAKLGHPKAQAILNQIKPA